MTLIKCPNCNRTVSSVASRCPNCGALLTQYRFVQGQGGTLTECRRCSRKVLSGAMACPYCGVPRPGRRTPYVAAILVVALAAPVALFAVLYSRAPAPRPVAVEQPVAAPAPRRVPPPPVQSPVARPELQPSDAGPDASPGGEAGATPAGAVTKWTLDWANVREGRALGTTVVHVLRPGEPVLVGDRQAGWWAVYHERTVVGYVAGSVLGDQPPRGAPSDSARGVGG